MGMYDSVYICCPKCDTAVEFQSKAGRCTMETYRKESVPPAIAEDITNDVYECEGCGLIVGLVPTNTTSIKMDIIIKED